MSGLVVEQAKVVPSRSVHSGDQGIHSHLDRAEVTARCGLVRLFTTNPVLVAAAQR